MSRVEFVIDAGARPVLKPLRVVQCTTTLFDYNRALLGLALLSSKHFCIFDVHGSVYIPVVIFGGVTSFSLPFSELTWLTNHHPSLL